MQMYTYTHPHKYTCEHIIPFEFYIIIYNIFIRYFLLYIKYYSNITYYRIIINDVLINNKNFAN